MAQPASASPPIVAPLKEKLAFRLTMSLEFVDWLWGLFGSHSTSVMPSATW